METFIYYCENEAGVEMTFVSRAFLEPGLTVFDNDKLPFVINSALVSNSIYYCIFYNMLTQDEEVTIIDKIANNRKRHCKLPPKDPNCFMRKYLKVLDDRNIKMFVSDEAKQFILEKGR